MAKTVKATKATKAIRAKVPAGRAKKVEATIRYRAKGFSYTAVKNWIVSGGFSTNYAKAVLHIANTKTA